MSRPKSSSSESMTNSEAQNSQRDSRKLAPTATEASFAQAPQTSTKMRTYDQLNKGTSNFQITRKT